MKIYKLGEKISAFIFDIDGTLYNSQEYVAEQVDCQIRHWAALNGMTADEGRKKMQAFRDQWAATHEGKRISLGNAFTYFGVDIKTSIEWRNNLMRPEDFLSYDQRLFCSLKELKEGGFKMLALTNNPVAAARRTLAAVGIDSLITDIVGLDTCCLSKPAQAMIDRAVEILKCPTEEIVAVGDRYDIDLALPLKNGMGAIEVKGAFELYDLPGILQNRAKYIIEN